MNEETKKRIKLVMILSALLTGFEEITERLYEIDIPQVFNEDYPFHKSFDEITADLREWILKLEKTEEFGLKHLTTEQLFEIFAEIDKEQKEKYKL